jgi:uncharacterized protein YggT (Ycf19 family)
MAGLIGLAITIYADGLIIYVILSWIRNPQVDKIRALLGKFYEPLLLPLRAFIKPIGAGGGQLDITPIILLLGLILLRRLISL